MWHLKQENTFKWLNIEFLKNCQTPSLDSHTHCLARLEAKEASYDHNFMPQQQTHLWDMPLG